MSGDQVKLGELSESQIKIILTTLTLAVMTDSPKTLNNVMLNREFVDNVLNAS